MQVVASLEIDDRLVEFLIGLAQFVKFRLDVEHFVSSVICVASPVCSTWPCAGASEADSFIGRPACQRLVSHFPLFSLKFIHPVVR